MTIEEAVQAGQFHGDAHVIARGDVDAALAEADVQIQARCESGGQDHFYLETQVAHAVP